MMEAWRLARIIPTTFDGTPPELLSPDGQPELLNIEMDDLAWFFALAG
jgi:hypothetical protein